MIIIIHFNLFVVLQALYDTIAKTKTNQLKKKKMKDFIVYDSLLSCNSHRNFYQMQFVAQRDDMFLFANMCINVDVHVCVLFICTLHAHTHQFLYLQAVYILYM